MGTVGILGTMHGEDSFREEIGYTLDVMKEAILNFKPDIICGEVRPEDWQKYCEDKNYSGYLGPNEYRRMIIPLCEKENIKFVPVDWFEDDMIGLSYFRNYDKPTQEALLNEVEQKYKEIFEFGKRSRLPLNSIEWNEVTREKQNWLGSLDSTLHNIYWIARNQLMLERIKKVINENKDKRILCTVGAEHNYFYYDELKKLNCELVFPLK
ncbi:hypothetical protein JK636_14525 [Clostridium sp. YIM B02515]|uniref:Uncharacterized protein n=1 Tax=Clostridium rhizosphaerae TaxID=2803861 RepID=A0ABS1TEC4_9CLOT|nr:hypothetical protein [Clostridium rhizosphaerae]MBL4936966.1 hypothetical protein [Clostridium rhizosphaerae]